MQLTDVMTVLEELAPLRYAESWDNVGLLVGDPRAVITKVLVTVDYTAAVAEEAVALGATLVVAYHPALFAAVKRVPHDALWADAVRRGIALYSPHTALDVARGGTNDFLADACAMHATERRALRPFASRGDQSKPER
ncbi:MAG TPA: Nif3-like dinuclear metal center hexameric protein, partial [Labilithrix sp.]|nr:Nif3-like dinuclear metal center hexameric protein [Labilithrix sp.]